MRVIAIILLGSLLFYGARHLSIVHSASSPVVTSVITASTSGGDDTTLTLLESTTATLYVHGAITDADGCEDVANNGTVTGTFYRTTVSGGSACSVDNNDCYTLLNANCTKTNCTGPGDTTLDYECTAQIQYYADSTTSGPHTATNWTAKIQATDASTANGSSTDTIEMNTTIALRTTQSISYGAIDLGAESTQKTLTITNSGNAGIDVDLSANTVMSCADGTIPIENVHYSDTTGFSYANASSTTLIPAQYELNLANRTNDAASSTKNLYFILKMPSTGVGGSCSNALIVDAKADTGGGW